MANFEKHDIEWDDEKIARIWDYYSANDSYKSQYFGLQVGKYVVEEALKHIGKFESLLDFSCGTGELLKHFIENASASQKFYGCDVSEKSIAQVNERFKSNSNFVSAVSLDNIDNIAQKQFDVIVSTEVIEHLSDENLSNLMGKCHQLLKPGGKLVLTTPNNEDLEASKILCPECGCTFHRWQHERIFTKESLKSTVESYSFRTNVVKEMFWTSKLMRLIFFFKPQPKTSLFYVGSKQ